MEVIQTNISGELIVEPRVFKDSRGYFFGASLRGSSMNRRTKQEQSQACLNFALQGGGRPKVKGYAHPWAQYQLRARQQDNVIIRCDARSALSAYAIYPEQTGALRKRRCPRRSR